MHLSCCLLGPTYPQCHLEEDGVPMTHVAAWIAWPICRWQAQAALRAHLIAGARVLEISKLPH